jgi:hypothetical protein
MPERTLEGFGDDDSTWPPPPDTDTGAPAASRPPSAHGDFKDRDTSVAAATEGGIVSIRLTSARGDLAHIAVDLRTAAVVAQNLSARIADPYFESFFPAPAERSIPTGALKNLETDLFFPKDDEPRVLVNKDPDDDLIALRIRSGEASLHISMQVGVAFMLARLCFAAAAAGS